MTAPHVGNRRLLKLADFLSERVGKTDFDINVIHNGGTRAPTVPGCGTAACAIGWAGTMPAFNRLGFKYHPEWPGAPSLPGTETWKSVRTFFALDYDDVDQLFMPDGYRFRRRAGHGTTYQKNPTPKQVAAKIRRFVARRERAAA